MHENDKIVYDKIKQNTYFHDCFEWYADKYLYPITQRSTMIIIVIISCLALFITYINIKILPDERVKIPFAVYAEDTNNFSSHIKPLIKKENIYPQQATAEYLIKDYIKTRESYSFENFQGSNLDKIKKKIKGTSVKKISDEFSRYISSNSPYSPINRLGQNKSLSIDIKEIKFISDDLIKGKAKVRFVLKEVDNQEKNSYNTDKNYQPITSNWEALIFFMLPDIVSTSKTRNRLGFLVTHYEKINLDNK